MELMMIPIQQNTSTMIDASTQTKSFDELVKEHLQGKLPKELFELPEEAYDPVTKEEFKKRFVTNCGHVFEKDTLYNLAKTTLKTDNTMNCPICRNNIKYNTFYFPRSLRDLSEKLKEKISTIKNKIGI